MTTKYLCVHCDETFEHEGDKKPRCPECMRVNGLEEVSPPKKEAAERPPWLPWAVAGGLALVIGIGYVY